MEAFCKEQREEERTAKRVLIHGTARHWKEFWWVS